MMLPHGRVVFGRWAKKSKSSVSNNLCLCTTVNKRNKLHTINLLYYIIKHKHTNTHTHTHTHKKIPVCNSLRKNFPPSPVLFFHHLLALLELFEGGFVSAPLVIFLDAVIQKFLSFLFVTFKLIFSRHTGRYDLVGIIFS